MDDILLLTKRGTRDTNDQNDIISQLRADCYHKPLTLEEGTEGVFLETEFSTDGHKEWSYQIRNGRGTKVWRYHHNDSGLPFEMKKATMIAILRKVHKMASGKKELLASATAKLAEFRRLRYSCGLRKFMCAIMARDYNSTIWRYVRSLQD